MKSSRNSPWAGAVFPWLRTAIVTAMLVIVIETFLVLGIVTPVAIEGSSMVPALLGPHVQVTCPHCAWEFAVGGDQLPGDWPLVCPDCRESFHEPDAAPLNPGRRLLVDLTRYALCPPARWDVVVFRCPEQASQLCVKRVLGLPGEQVAFDAGDLIVDGELIRKSIDEQLKLRQLVHREREESRFWKSDSSGWEWDGDAWHHTGGDMDVLEFHPPGGVVTDDQGVNQRATRLLHDVTDLMVTCEASLSPGARVVLHADFGEEVTVSGKVAPATGRTRIIWSLFDLQMLLVEDGSILAKEVHSSPWQRTPRLEVMATGEVTLGELTIWRDAYYHTRPVDRWSDDGVKLGESELFVVGDNVAISADSRSWDRPGLPTRLIVGAPFFVD